MEWIGIGILLMIGFYLTPIIIGLVVVAIAGIVQMFTKENK